MCCRTRAPCNLFSSQLAERFLAEPLQPVEGVAPTTHLRLIRRGPDPATPSEVAFNRVRAAERFEFYERVGRQLAEPQRLARPAQTLEREEPRPPRKDEAAVA